MKRCRTCNTLFEVQFDSMREVCCSVPCAIEWASTDKGKKHAQTAYKAETRRMRADAKTKGAWMKEAEAVFNKFIRLRDVGKPCISCLKPPRKKNAGHFKSKGRYPELRFNEDNVHLQCEYCNTYLSGNLANYRPNLIDKIGLERVEALEGPRQLTNYIIEDLKEIKAKYKAKVKSMESE